jgi:hypothetical protein
MNDLLKELDVCRRSLCARGGMNRVQVQSSRVRNRRRRVEAAVDVRIAKMREQLVQLWLPRTVRVAQLIGNRTGHIVTAPDLRASVEGATASWGDRLLRRVHRPLRRRPQSGRDLIEGEGDLLEAGCRIGDLGLPVTGLPSCCRTVSLAPGVVDVSGQCRRLEGDGRHVGGGGGVKGLRHDGDDPTTQPHPAGEGVLRSRPRSLVLGT